MNIQLLLRTYTPKW